MTDYCVARTQGEAPWYRSGPCSRKAVRDGYCNIHHPDKAKARRARAAAEADARWKAKQARSPWVIANRYRDALRKIADGHNDARAVALQALGEGQGTEREPVSENEQ